MTEQEVDGGGVDGRSETESEREARSKKAEMDEMDEMKDIEEPDP
jgi:hypothetical protein